MEFAHSRDFFVHSTTVRETRTDVRPGAAGIPAPVVSINLSISFSLCWLAILLAVTSPLLAGIVEMPDVEQAPPLYGRSVFENYNIPSTVNRSPDPNLGPRLWVKEIRIQGLENFPSLNIRREEIIAYIEKRRFDTMREDQVMAHGFTEQEVAEVLKLLNEMEVANNYEHISTPQLQRFIWLVRNQKERRGLTLGQIESLAADVEKYYHSHGLQLARAFIPRQSMRDGVLVIEVMNGKLGAVDVEPSNIYDARRITGPFDDMLTEPVSFERIEERMYLINDYPGINVSGTFKPGYQPGDTRLHLSVNQEERIETTLRLDNHGSELTGTTRGFAQFFINNPGGLADQLNLSLLQSTSPDNSTYGAIGYRLPVYGPRLQLGLNISTNQFVLDQQQDASGSINSLGITGETRQAGISFEYTIKRSRAASWWARITQDTTETILDSDEFGNLGLDDKIRNLRLTGQFDLLNSQAKLLHLGSLTISSGEFIYGAGEERDNNYSKLNGSYTLMTFVPLGWFDTTTRLLVKTELQYSSDALPAAEQNALASPTTTRAYPVNQFSADSSLYLGLEWVFNTPDWLLFESFRRNNIHQKMQPVLFVNAARGRQNAITDTQDVEGTLVDAGFGFQFAFGKSTNGNLQFAFPVNDDFSRSNISVPDDAMKVVFDVQYRF